MKLLSFAMIFVCAAQWRDGAAFACNLKVFQPEERRQHVKLTHEIMTAIVQHQELPQGYSPPGCEMEKPKPPWQRAGGFPCSLYQSAGLFRD